MIVKNGMYLHAVAVSGPKGAILLLGHSSSGKTTLGSLVSRDFPVLGDDWLFVFPDRNGEWMVADGKRLNIRPETCNPGMLDELCHKGIARPVHSLIRIFAAEKTELKSISSLKTCEYIMNAVFEIPMQSMNTCLHTRRQWFQSAADMARKYRGWRLQFSLNEERAMNALRQAS